MECSFNKKKCILSQLFVPILLIVIVGKSLLADFGVFRAELDIQIVALCSKESQNVLIMLLHYCFTL